MKKKAAVFTIVHNEKDFLPIWYRHYLKSFHPHDIYILDHNSSDGSTDAYEVVKLNMPEVFNHSWLLTTVQDFYKELCRDYEWVVFSEVDELIIHKEYENLQDYLNVISNGSMCSGLEVIHNFDEEKEIDLNLSLLNQRRFARPNVNYNKILIANQPLEWSVGFHRCYNFDCSRDENLILLHLRYLDYNLCYNRINYRLDVNFCPADAKNKLGWQNNTQTLEEFRRNWPKIECEIPSWLNSRI